MSAKSAIAAGVAAMSLIGIGVATNAASSDAIGDAGVASAAPVDAYVAPQPDAAPPSEPHRPGAMGAAWLGKHPAIAAHMIAGLPVLGTATADPSVQLAAVAATYDTTGALYSDVWSEPKLPGTSAQLTVTLPLGATPIGMIVRDAVLTDGTDGHALGHFDLAQCAGSDGVPYTTKPTDDTTGTVFCTVATNRDSATHRFVADFAYRQ